MKGRPSLRQISCKLAGRIEGQLARFDDAGAGDQEQRLIQPDLEAAQFHDAATPLCASAALT
jgi:hypothetical protein